MRTVSIRELAQQVSKTVRAAEDEPVLVRKADEPAVWMVGANELARVAREAMRGDDFYQTVLRLLAVHLFDQGVLSMGQGARLASLPLAGFLELCDRLGVPVLREPDEGIAAEADAFERWLKSARRPAAPTTPADSGD